MKRALLYPGTCILIGCLAGPSGAWATTFFVNANCGDDSWSGRSAACVAPTGPKCTIQAAINASSSGDEVIIAPGVYTGTSNTEITVGSRNITVRSEAPDDPGVVAATVLDGQWRNALFRLASPQTFEAHIRGLTLRRGFSSPNPYAGAVTLLQVDAIIEQCVFEANIGSTSGGAITCVNSEVAIRNCVFIGNTVAGAGGAVCCVSATPTILNCTFIGNGARSGGAINVSPSDGIPVIRNCILWANTATTAGTAQIEVGNSTPAIDYCDIQDGTGQWWFHSNNIDVDPRLTADARLTRGSACLDAGTVVGAPPQDRDGEGRPEGSGFDMGADEFVDSDADGLPDFWERRHFGSVTAAALHEDADADRLDNLAEYEAGSDPRAADTDADTWSDGEETARGSNPTRPNIYVNGANGDDLFDGRAPVWSGGTRGPKRTIQAGIVAAGPFESVVIRSGVYSGSGNYNLDFAAGLASGARPINVQSENPFDPAVVAATIIDPEQHGRAFQIRSAYSRLTCVQGLTLRNGRAHAVIAPTNGGAIKCDESNPTIRHCVLTDNTADAGSSWSDGNGGAMSFKTSYPFLADCLLSGNVAQRGGGVSCHGSDPVIINCQFVGNSAADQYDGGGAIYAWTGSSPRMDRCVLVANTSTGKGGGVYFDRGTPTIRSCLFVGNTAPGGGGLYAYSGGPSILNCTFTGNSSLEGWGGGISLESSPTVVENCILWGNSPSQVHNRYGAGPTVAYSNIEGGWTGDGNIDQDPRFADPRGADGDPGTWQDNDYRLSDDSPCVDAGNNNPWTPLAALDLLGRPRRIDAPAIPDSGAGSPPIVDIGAYEFMPGIAGDFDGDGDVDQDDLRVLEGCASGPLVPRDGSEKCRQADLDGDNDVDQSDFGIFQRCWSDENVTADPNCAK
ncbi:MAG TPA: right-handed parallel beta-helix repeat-containing protein [Phycisphaerae bacterium]|nr:right-handed parallel beta-helix repeat-containing protein [Phycisphaerae bacterium]HRY70903.1 right-handed parallel beta-helix repeat-containing protein [Phycisphaerae bacterium]HSA29402.1 right-handed parallel beta-helix repeat-containing protein [Phycisphaerae bacterium]